MWPHLLMYLAQLSIEAWAQIAAAIIAGVALLVSVWTFLIERRASRAALGADMLFRLSDRFDNDDMVESRKAAATALITNENLSDIEGVLDFFETLGMYCKKRILDPELVWSEFFYYLNFYYLPAKNYIKSLNARNPTVYEYLIWLRGKLCEIERNKTTDSSDLSPTADAIKQFLEREAS